MRLIPLAQRKGGLTGKLSRVKCGAWKGRRRRRGIRQIDIKKLHMKLSHLTQWLVREGFNFVWVNFAPSVFGNMRGTIRGGGRRGGRGSPQRERKNCTVVSARSQGRRRHVKYALPQSFVRFGKTQQFCEKFHSAFPIVRIRSAGAVLWTFPASHFCTQYIQTLIGRGPHKKAGEC